MIPVLAVLLAILMMLTGLVMLVVGLRGKKVDDHPHCRRCRFDLNHRWPDTTTCPECGHTHTKRRPRQGMRQREPRRVVCAMPVLTIALAMLLAFAGGNLGVNLNKYKPLGWLMWEVRHAPSGAASSAIQEIADRRLALELSNQQLTLFVDSILALQADVDRAWRPVFGDLVVSMRDLGEVTDAQWNLYEQQVVPARLEHRSKVRSGGWFAAELIVDDVRGDSKCDNQLPYLSRVEIAGVQSRVEAGPIRTQNGRRVIPLRNVRAPALQPGPYVADVRVRGSRGYGPPLDLQVQVDIEVVSAETSVVEVVTDPSHAPTVFRRDTAVELLGIPAHSVHVNIEFSDRPCDLVMQVIHDLDEGRWMDQPFTLHQQSSQKSFYWSRPLSQYMNNALARFDTVDIVLKPDLDLAEQTFGITRIWGKPMIIKDVPVTVVE